MRLLRGSIAAESTSAFGFVSKTPLTKTVYSAAHRRLLQCTQYNVSRLRAISTYQRQKYRCTTIEEVRLSTRHIGTVDEHQLKSAFRSAISSVWVIATADAAGRPAGFTAISLVSVSASPALISFNIGKTSSTLPILKESMQYAGHLLESSQLELAQLFARKPTQKRFECRDHWMLDEAGLPRIHGATTRLVGRVMSLIDAGDSYVAICNVEVVEAKSSEPLIYSDGNYVEAVLNNRTQEANNFQPFMPTSANMFRYNDLRMQTKATSQRRALFTSIAGSSSNARGIRTLTSSTVVPSSSVSSRPSRIFLNAFDMGCISHQPPGLWRHPECTKANGYKTLSYWTKLATLLDQGGFDSLFLADVLGIYDVYAGSRDAAVRSAAQVPVIDPLLLVSAMAAVTKHLGFGITVATTYEKPYSFARKMSTLDHLTNGRIAWNVVTSYLHSAAINLGLDKQIPHDQRYDIADEFMSVCYKLWEQSWQDNAVQNERRVNGIYAIPTRVRDIKHEGQHFNVPGAHLVEPSPQRTPFIFQAGASGRGQEFAAKHAEAVFCTGVTPESLRPTVDGFRKLAEKMGRHRRSLKIFALITPIVDETDEAARTKFEDYKKYVSIEGALALYGGWTGTDLSQLDPDTPLNQVDSDAIQSVARMWSTKIGHNIIWTPRTVAEWIGIGGLGPVLVGSPKTVVNELERWVDVADIDGFNLAYATTPGTFQSFIEHAVPELRRRGRLPVISETDPLQTIRERYGGLESWSPSSNGAHLADSHPGKNIRI